MEANIQIKNAEVEGKKIKKLEFFGDWEIEMGGGDEPVETILRPVYNEKYPYGRDTLPYHVIESVRTKQAGAVTWYGYMIGDPTTDKELGYPNVKYAVRIKIPGTSGSLSGTAKFQSRVETQRPATQSKGEMARIYFFSEDMTKLLGFARINYHYEG
jgi:hypothetical protein